MKTSMPATTPWRWLRALAAGIAVLCALPATAQDKMQLQLNWFHLADHSPIYLAMKKGYYKEENIELTVLRGSGSADSAKKIDLGQADVGISDAPTVLTAISKGANLKMVAVVYDKAGNNVFFKKSANIKTPKDLAGKRIAVTQVGSSFHYSLGLLADKYGFKLSEVKVLPLQSLSNAAAALKGETVDAALLPVSTARALMDSNGAKLLGWVGDETPWQLGAVFASTKTVADKALVTKVLAALVRADREYHDVILTSIANDKVPINDKTKPLLEIIAKYTNLPVEKVVGNSAYIDPDGKLDVKNVDNQIKWLQEQGFVDKGFAADAIVAKDYVKAD